MRPERHAQRGISRIEVVIIVSCVALLVVLLVFLLPPVGRDGELPPGVRCLSNLSQIAKAMNLYLNIHGDQSMYSIPAASFRGDSWLASLYWTGIIKEPRCFICRDSGDRGQLPARPPRDLALAGAIPPDAVSYAGLCRGLTGPLAHRNTRSFTEAAISSACVLACDDNEGSQNHPDGMCRVFFDSHVEFKAGTRAETYDLIGAPDSPYSYLDSGE